MIGILIAFRGRKKFGLVVVGASVAWYTFATRVIIPWQNGIGPFYDSFFGDLGNNPAAVATHLAAPSRGKGSTSPPSRTASTTYRMMLAPVAFAPAGGAPGVPRSAAAMLGVNVISSFP